MTRYYCLQCFVPLEYKEKVKNSIFAAGAGKLGNYDQCCFETLGTGQFRPLEGSLPHTGQCGSVSQVPEVKIECIVSHQHIQAVISALIASHPYETPAFQYWEVYTQ